MNKKIRQVLGLLSAIIVYTFIHEGAHLLYALSIGVFKQVNFLHLGMQIDIYVEKTTSFQLGIFCLVGSIATAISAYLLTSLAPKIKKLVSKPVKACLYYITIALLLIDPIYLSLLYPYFGGGDMNGIQLLIPEFIARILYGCLLIIHLIVFIKYVLPQYKQGFQENK